MNVHFLLGFVSFSSCLLGVLRAEVFVEADKVTGTSAPVQSVGTLSTIIDAGNLVRIIGENLNWTSNQPADYSIFYLPLPPIEGAILSVDSKCGIYTLTPTFIQTACDYSDVVNYYFVDCVVGTTLYSVSSCTNSVTGGPTFAPTSSPTWVPTAFPTATPTAPSSRPSSQPSSQPSRQPIALPSGQPIARPSSFPTNCPSSIPTALPTPSGMPSYRPSVGLTVRPTRTPTTGPTFFNPPLSGHNATHNATSSASAAEKNKASTFIQSPVGISIIALGGLTVAAVISRTLWSCYGTKTQQLQNDMVISPMAHV